VALLAGTGLDESLADEMEGRIMSGFVRATKPRARACGCADDCCS
jgi:hypothetical protein